MRTEPIWDDHPELHRPVLVAGFTGWNDAADSASDAVEWLATNLDGRPFARIDPERYYDFQSTRPHVSVRDAVTEQITWPRNQFSAATATGSQHDLIILRGVEPNFSWRSFCAGIIDVARETGCELVVTLGALLADVPHTRTPAITGTATDPDLIARLGLERSRYEGPTGIVGVLHDACRNAGLVSASLWAPVPHYVAAAPDPMASRELVSRFAQLTGLDVDLTELDLAAEGWRSRVSAAVVGDSDTAAYVAELESRFDAEARDSGLGDLPSGDDLAAELERYLREHRGEEK
ncbi:MAG: PAC2 family protein [Acidimicrobiia bacterium]